MSLVLMRRELDCWQPGQHTGTFRGNQLAYVAASAALELWNSCEFKTTIEDCSQIIEDYLRDRITANHSNVTYRGLGMIWGVDLTHVVSTAIAQRVSKRCFEVD